MSLVIGQVYEIRNRCIIDYGAKKTPEREFMKLMGYSSKGLPVFQDGEKFREIGGEWQDIYPLKEQQS